MRVSRFTSVLLGTLLYIKTTLFKFYDNCCKISGVQFFYFCGNGGTGLKILLF